MNCRKNTIIVILLFLTTFINLQATAIKHIFIDINAIIATSQAAASKVVGVINSMKYVAKVGHIPSKSDFFKALKHVPAKSNQITYNEDLVMPSILSDWLLGLQSHNSIRFAIHQYLDQHHFYDIERTIFKNIASMMMSPTLFIDTQYVVKDIAKILHQLKKSSYEVYLIGNWDKDSEPYLMKLLNGHFLPDARHCYFSNKAKQLKPNPEYFDQLLSHYNVHNKHECLIIDIEKHHAQGARNAGFSTILLHGQNPVQLKSELIRIGIRI